MKKFLDSIKDFLYDSIDVILVLVILLAVGGTILWRLDILFTPDVEKTPLEQPIEISDDTNDSTGTENEDKDEDNINNDNTGENNQNSTTENDNTNTDNSNTSKVITVEIPQGSLGPHIADILISKGLLGVNDKWTFLNTAHSLGLDTELKAGTFQISENSSMDYIIKIIAKKL